MSNPISPELIKGTYGELLVQILLLQFKVQAAPPLKDSGNDLIAVRDRVFRSIQVKTTAGDDYDVPEERKVYDILAAVHLIGEESNVSLDASDVYLIKKEDVRNSSRRFSDISRFKLSAKRINDLFPMGEFLPNQAAEPTRTSGTPPADAGDRASGARGSL